MLALPWTSVFTFYHGHLHLAFTIDRQTDRQKDVQKDRQTQLIA